MKKLKKVDIVSVLLALFMLLLVSVFIYLYSVSKYIDQYTQNSDNLATMQLIDKDFNNFALTTNQFNNYDVVNADLKTFKIVFFRLQKDLLVMYPNNQAIKQKLSSIEKEYNDKENEIEDFKSLNASLINASHFLFDLQTTISQNNSTAPMIKDLVDETLFYLFRYISSSYINKSYITVKLDKIKKRMQQNYVKHIDTFYIQAKATLDTVASLKKSSHIILTSKLGKTIRSLTLLLKNKYERNLFVEKLIAILFFISTIIVLIALVFLHIKGLRYAKKLLEAKTVYDNTMQAIVVGDEEGRVTSVNHTFEQMYGYTLEDVKGKKLSILHSGLHNKSFYVQMWEQIHNEGVFKGKVINQAKDGTHIPVWVTIKKVIDKQDGGVTYIGLETDLRELESSIKKIDFLAYHDSLTGLYNRSYFEDYLKHALRLAKRSKSLIGILFIDLDRFKIINDTLGHDVGDQVLLVVAKRIQKQLRESDFIARWGGDEFVVVLEGINAAEDAGFVAANIINALQKPMEIGTNHLTTTASIGITCYPENGQDAQTLIKYADSAMYLAKDGGKNNFRYFTQALSKETKKRLDIALYLQNAIENDELYMVFQPQYNLQTQAIIATEALVRWEHKELGLVPPDIFIPIAEESGNIVKIGYFVFEASCQALNAMKKANLSVQYIAINVSTLQFNEPDLIEKFLAILSRYHLGANEIEIEITERFIVQNAQNNVGILERFRKNGFKISVDDFGTGYSSMSYLKELPADTIKIDKSFIDGVKKEDSDDNVIVKAIIGLAHTLHYNIVAEGIETKEQESFLLENSCDIGQGYLYSKPLKLEQLLKKLW